MAMKKAKKQIEERKIFGLIRSSNRLGSHLNCFRVYRSESNEHIRKKFEAWLFLISNGFNCYTECIISGGRLDILAVKEGIGYAVEILEIETEEECMKKLKYLPEGIFIKLIKSTDELKNWSV